jgi:hypothetical protein
MDELDGPGFAEEVMCRMGIGVIRLIEGSVKIWLCKNTR